MKHTVLSGDDNPGSISLFAKIFFYVWFGSLCPINNLSVIKGWVFLG